MKANDCCNYHQEGMDKINGIIITASIRLGEDIYNGRPFQYCPWCGTNRQDSPKPNKENLGD